MSKFQAGSARGCRAQLSLCGIYLGRTYNHSHVLCNWRQVLAALSRPVRKSGTDRAKVKSFRKIPVSIRFTYKA